MTKKRVNDLIKTFAEDFEVSVVLKNGRYIGVIIDGIDKENKLVGWFHYGVRHTDDDWCQPATIEPRVVVNRYGEFLSDVPFKFPKGNNNDYVEIVGVDGCYELDGNNYSLFKIK